MSIVLTFFLAESVPAEVAVLEPVEPESPDVVAVPPEVALAALYNFV